MVWWTPLLLVGAEARADEVWIVQGDPGERPLKQAMRKLARRGGAVLVPLTQDRWCVTFAATPTAELERKAERWLSVAPEVRMDCTVGAYPLGRGWLAYVIAAPATGIEDVVPALVEDLSLYQRVLHRPSDPTSQPSRLCVSGIGISDPAHVTAALRERGLTVDAIYEVGGCFRP